MDREFDGLVRSRLPKSDLIDDPGTTFTLQRAETLPGTDTAIRRKAMTIWLDFAAALLRDIDFAQPDCIAGKHPRMLSKANLLETDALLNPKLKRT